MTRRVRPYTSVMVMDDMRFGKIIEEMSPSLGDLKLLDGMRRDFSYGDVGKSRGSSTCAMKDSTQVMNNSTYGMNDSTKRSRLGQKLKDLEIRSTRSIKEEESADEFSEVLSSSKASVGRKVSLSNLLGNKTQVRRVHCEE